MSFPTYLPLVFDLSTPSGPAGWRDTTTDSFLAKGNDGGRFMMAQITPTILPCCDPESLNKGERRIVDNYRLLDVDAVAAFLGRLACHQNPTNLNIHISTLRTTLNAFANPLDTHDGSVEKLRASQTTHWISASGIWALTSTPATNALRRWRFGFDTMVKDYKANLIPNPHLESSMDKTDQGVIVVPMLAPELDSHASAHLRLHVYSDLKKTLTYSVLINSKKRAPHLIPDDLTILPPIHAGTLIYT